MGYWGYFNGAVSMLVGLLSALGLDFGIFIGLGLFGISTVFMIITAQKFDYNPKGEGRMGKSRRRQQFGSVGVTVVSLVVVVLLLLFTMRPTNITIDDAGITIHGMYGQTYAWESISEMELIDELPGISRRTNGASVGPYLKGGSALLIQKQSNCLLIGGSRRLFGSSAMLAQLFLIWKVLKQPEARQLRFKLG